MRCEMITCKPKAKPSSSTPKRLLAFFSGVASQREHFLNLSALEFDVAFFYDYQSFSYEPITGYDTVDVVGWSMGVAVASRLAKEMFKNPSFRLAINGTPQGIDRLFGIHQRIFAASVNEFSPYDFGRAMGASWLEFDRGGYNSELASLQEFCKSPCFVRYDTVAISQNDTIFPPNACLRYANEAGARVVNLNKPHYIFDEFSSWDELCVM